MVWCTHAAVSRCEHRALARRSEEHRGGSEQGRASSRAATEVRIPGVIDSLSKLHRSTYKMHASWCIVERARG